MFTFDTRYIYLYFDTKETAAFNKFSTYILHTSAYKCSLKYYIDFSKINNFAIGKVLHVRFKNVFLFSNKTNQIVKEVVK